MTDPIDDIIKREGPESNSVDDKGGRTAYGISERSNPSAWFDDKVTEAEARAIYEQKYVLWPKFNLITDPLLRTQLIDYGVNSGPGVAILKLQGILHVTADGVIGPETLGALAKADPTFVNNQLVAARVKMIGNIVHNNPSQIKWLNGWLDRACQFLR